MFPMQLLKFPGHNVNLARRLEFLLGKDFDPKEPISVRFSCAGNVLFRPERFVMFSWKTACLSTSYILQQQLGTAQLLPMLLRSFLKSHEVAFAHFGVLMLMRKRVG